jgi:hypothetical protein
MTSERAQLRNAIEAADTRLRAFKARISPVSVLGGKNPEPMTEEFEAGLARLEAACVAARQSLRDATV